MSKVITNLEEFFEARGFEFDDRAMYTYGRALYKYTFGPWISYLVRTRDESYFKFAFLAMEDANGKVTYRGVEGLPMDLVRFFGAMDKAGEEVEFETYVEQVKQYVEAHPDQLWSYHLAGSVLVINGEWQIPEEVEDVYYESDEAGDTLEMAKRCVGVKVGSIIEGADYDATPFELYFPFTNEEYERSMDALEEEVRVEWEKVNSLYYSLINPETGEKELWCQWVEFDDNPKGNFEEDDEESLALARAGGLALQDTGGTRVELPDHKGWIAVEEDCPDY